MTWKAISREQPYDERGDPYFHLRTGTKIPKGFASPDWSALRPAVIRLVDDDAAALARQYGVLVPAFYTNPIRNTKQTAYCTALVGRTFIEIIERQPLRFADRRPASDRCAIGLGVLAF